ncbi:MAG TPA: hypothetical protein PLV56_09145 [Synergistales bacterium]|nr:hypothetical protein [Synergistales bacterium]
MIDLCLWGLMFLILLLFLVYARSRGSWMKLISFCSLSIKGGLLILLWSCKERSPELISVGLAILVLGGVGVMILAIFLERGPMHDLP